MTSTPQTANHALSSGFFLLPHEKETELNSIATRLRADLQPGGEHESFLVDRMIEARWRIVRINRLEAAAFDLILDPDAVALCPDARIAARLTPKGGDVLGVLQRYAAAAERSYHKNYRELLHARQVSQTVEQKAVDNAIKNTIFAPLPGQAVPNGFASQKSQNLPKISVAPHAPEPPTSN